MSEVERSKLDFSYYQDLTADTCGGKENKQNYEHHDCDYTARKLTIKWCDNHH